MRVFFTGGSGKAGRHVTRYLADQGHRLLNFDLTPLGSEGIHDIIGDITDLGQVVSALTGYAGFDELEPGGGPPPFDAVVHFAAVPRILLTPDNECYRVNTLGTYNVFEAAAKLGIRKVIFASSETTYGVCFHDGRADPDYLPVDEDHPTVPQDSYATSKVVNEVTARSFHARTGADFYGLRIGNVIEPHEYVDLFPQFFETPEIRRRNVFNYIDARDLGQIVDLCLAKDGLGFEVFNTANDDNSVNIPAAELAERFFPGVEHRSPLTGDTGLYSNRKARDILGFRQNHAWASELS
ncbi:MAG: NAD(P)-dependent oxidoreductase [Pseudomonadota bacterium]